MEFHGKNINMYSVPQRKLPYTTTQRVFVTRRGPFQFFIKYFYLLCLYLTSRNFVLFKRGSA